MNKSIYIEQRQLVTSSLAWDIAHHLYSRQIRGKVIVITDQPLILLSSVKKAWNKLGRQVLKERSSTLNTMRLVEFGHVIAWMQSLKFTAKTPYETPDGDVFFMEPGQLGGTLIGCHTVYVVGGSEKDGEASVGLVGRSTRLVVQHGLVVVYGDK